MVESEKLAAEDRFNVFHAIGQHLCLFVEAKFASQADGFAERVLSFAVMPGRISVDMRIVKLLVGILAAPDALIETIEAILAFLLVHHRTFRSTEPDFPYCLTSLPENISPSARLAIFFAFAPMAKTVSCPAARRPGQ